MYRVIMSVLLILVIGCANSPEPPKPEPEPPKPEPPEQIADEEPDTGNPLVKIKLRPQGPDNPRRIIVGPSGVGVCVRAAKGVCGDTIAFRWIGRKQADERITITFDDTAPPTSEDCFGKASGTIEDTGPAHEIAFTAGGGNGTCIPEPPAKPASAFFYTVSCEGGEGGNCGGVVPVDPGALVEHGGG